MEAEVAKAIEDLNKRMQYQEHIHRNIDGTKEGFLHGVVTNMPAIIVSMVLAGVMAYIVVRARENKA